MHPSMERLYKAAKEMKGVEGQSALARLLTMSPQRIKGWEDRGVSKQGAITAQRVIGCSALWITEEIGRMNLAQQFDGYAVSTSKYKKVWVIGKGQGGLPERIWTDGDFPVGASDEYAEVASADEHAFLLPVVGNSMSPRFNAGEYALVEPGTEPEIEDDVLVRLVTGETMLKRLLSRRGGYRFGSYSDSAILTYTPEEVTWMYYVAHPIPARKVKTRI
jgi:phage repressor protein C with HTH and peptisase S24 domain